MCGIAAIATADPLAPPREEPVRRMMAALAHRGPDAEGLWSGSGAAVGHRRLSIIDPEGGAQPMTTVDGRYTVASNGEIYNFRELGRELEQRGAQLRTRSDTEVLLEAFARWGEDCLPRLNGMFAFAVWDARERTLFAARDSAGIKPLYYCAGPDALTLASEIRAVNVSRASGVSSASGPSRASGASRTSSGSTAPSGPGGPGAPASAVDLVALDQFLTYRYVPAPRTIFEGIRKLAPGSRLIWRAGALDVRAWDTFAPRIDADRSEEDWLAALREALERAVARQMVADVPVGVLLSGGVDSGLVATLAARRTTRLRTFTVGFEGDPPENELREARETAGRIGAEHSELILTRSEYEDLIPRSMESLEEPIGTPSAAALLAVARLARRSVKVVLTGQGADEPLAGYARHRGEHLRPLLGPLLANPPVAALTRLLPRSERLKRAAYALGTRDIEERLLRTYALCDEPLKTRLLRPEILASLDGRRDLGGPIRPHLDRTSHLDPLSRMLFVDTRVWLPDDLLLYTDKATMAVSLEARVPLLDLDLLRLVESMPPRHKIRGLGSHKHLYKRAAAAWLPREVVYRKKKGFEAPVDRWLRGPMQETLRARFFAERGPLAGLFRPRELLRLLEEHRSGRQDRRRQIFGLYSLALCLETAGA